LIYNKKVLLLLLLLLLLVLYPIRISGEGFKAEGDVVLVALPPVASATEVVVGIGQRCKGGKKASVIRIRILKNISAVTRIRTWVASTTTKSTNHYTITATEKLLA
jgi:hypothetical protein